MSNSIKRSVGFYCSFMLLVIGCRPNGNQISLNGNDLFYTPAVSKEVVTSTGEYLLSTSFFADGGKSVQLDRVNNVPIFRLVVKKDKIQSEQTRQTAIEFGRILQKDLYAGNEFVFHLCDNQFKTLKSFHFQKTNSVKK